VQLLKWGCSVEILNRQQWTPRPVEDIHEFYTELLGIVDGQAQFGREGRDASPRPDPPLAI